MIYTGKKAKNILNKILQDHSDNFKINSKYEYPPPFVAGYYKGSKDNYLLSKEKIIEAKNKWIAFDNTTKNCWVEEFDIKKEAQEFTHGKN